MISNSKEMKKREKFYKSFDEHLISGNDYLKANIQKTDDETKFTCIPCKKKFN